jgi:hypothetical protein
MTTPSVPKSEATSSAPASSGVPSPLAEADAQSLEVLMSRDPFEMIVEDDSEVASAREARNFPTIVAALRRQREAWKRAEATGATKAPKAAKAKVTTSLEDLGLE